MKTYPWLTTLWQQFSQLSVLRHHAYLFIGQAGIGKMAFATQWSKLLLCANPTEDMPRQSKYACGECQNCRLFAAGTHPDLHLITSEASLSDSTIEAISAYAERYVENKAKKTQPGQFITVNQIRSLAEQVIQQPHIAKRKVIILYPAEWMNSNAANALLKLLEEPPKDTVFLLLSSLPGTLLPTIRSRCIRQNFPYPNLEQSRQWLSNKSLPDNIVNHATDMPLAVLRQYQSGELETKQTISQLILKVLLKQESAINISAKLHKEDVGLVFSTLEELSMKLIRAALNQESDIFFSATSVNVSDVTAQDVPLFYDQIVSYRKLEKTSLNKQLAIESILMMLSKIKRA